MQRFFVDFPLSLDLILIDPDIIHQLTRVLRAELWEDIILFDGDGSERLYRIEKIEKKSISLRWKSQTFPNTESKNQITLYQWMPNKIEKIEYILQKGVEVGIRKFVFFRSERSQKLVLTDAKKIRLITIAREALEQCGGLVMPDIEFYDQIIEYKSETTNLVLDTTGTTLKMWEVPQDKTISIWVWPEGGWSNEERNKMICNGFIFARFWERILRTETAGVVVAFALQYA